MLHDVFVLCSSVIKLLLTTPPSLHLLTASLLSVISSPLPLRHIAQLYFFMHALVYSINILIRCRCWDPLLYGALDLYSWPWMHILRGVMMEDSCPTTRGCRGNICYVCISWNKPVLQGQNDTFAQMKKKRNILDLCVTHGGFWSCSLTCDADLT